MIYNNTRVARFIERPNRFVAKVEIDGNVETVHVKNTGRCKELLLPDSKVVLCKSDNPDRKTKYDLIAVYKEGLGWVNIDSQIPNKVIYEWLLTNPKEIGDITNIKPEFTFGKSRIDFYIECDNRKILMEVKGCTLEKEGIGYFPDAPTTRGIKHLNELMGALSEGYESILVFVIAMPNVNEVRANIETHPEFGETLEKAKSVGVNVLMLPCEVCPDSICIGSNI